MYKYIYIGEPTHEYTYVDTNKYFCIYLFVHLHLYIYKMYMKRTFQSFEEKKRCHAMGFDPDPRPPKGAETSSPVCPESGTCRLFVEKLAHHERN